MNEFIKLTWKKKTKQNKNLENFFINFNFIQMILIDCKQKVYYLIKGLLLSFVTVFFNPIFIFAKLGSAKLLPLLLSAL